MKKVFVSLPMGDRKQDEILQEMDRLLHAAEAYLGEELELIPTYVEGDSPSVNHSALWYLGVSLKFMASADIVVFAPGSRRCRGCKIERLAANLYKIPTIDLSTYGLIPTNQEN